METVSVIIPTWNRAATIEAAVRSVLEQTHPVLEILVCDDGSDDATQNIISGIGDGRVKFISGPRAGRPAIPRNRGIKLAKGNWIAFLDSDDAWLPQKTEKQLAALQSSKQLASGTNAFRVLPGKGRVSPYLEIANAELSLEKIAAVNYIICSSALVHRSVLEKTGGFPEDEKLKAIEDYALWLRVVTQTSFTYLAEPLVDYSDNPAGSIRVNTKESGQRENVMRDFWEWSKINKALTPAREKLVHQQLRGAMKKNGRSFWERLKIK